MRAYLIFLLIIYFLYTTIKALWEHGLPFETVHWVLVAMCAAFIPLGVLFGKRCWIQLKEDKAKRTEEKQKAQEEASANKRDFYMDFENAPEDAEGANGSSAYPQPDSAPDAAGPADTAGSDDRGDSGASENASKSVFDC